jgi:hypothetical protein
MFPNYALRADTSAGAINAKQVLTPHQRTVFWPINFGDQAHHGGVPDDFLGTNALRRPFWRFRTR